MFPMQSSPMPTYHNVPPPYSQYMPSFNNIIPPSQSTMSMINYSIEATINNLAQTVSSLQQQIASMSQSKFTVPTFDVASTLSLDIVKVMPPKHVEVLHSNSIMENVILLHMSKHFKHWVMVLLMIKDFLQNYLQEIERRLYNGISLCLLIPSLLFNN